ncbi:MAG: tetratricopeptide repeat protein [Proteobacteria bacterium]|nr:tetratricopeptide repeat protein [Pseudomonadota bacterium]
MDDLLSEKEQIEQMRAWWSEYGGYVIGGLAIGVASLLGWNYWQDSRLEAQTEGSAMWEALSEHVVDGSLEEAEAVAGELGSVYAGTVYAAQARLAMARLYMDRNRDQDAADVLGELLASDADAPMKHVARTRLARILLYQGKAREVVDLLEGQASDAFAATWNELLGDAYHELGRIGDAQAAYQNALLDPAAQATVDRQLVQWKALDLPEADEQPEADEPPEADE